MERLNRNTLRDASEPGLAGWTIYLDANRNGTLDGGETSTVTDADGNYAFTGLEAGSYAVGEVMQSRWDHVSPGLGPREFLAATASSGPARFSLLRMTTHPVTETPLAPASFNAGLDFDPTSGLLYGASSSLRRFAADGSYTTLGSIRTASESNILLTSISFAPNGTLYGLSNSGQRLFQIDKTSGFATEIGTINATVRSIEFAPDGTLYAAFGNLYTVDPSTATVLQNRCQA